jgi:hypothetical protein
MQAFIPHDRFLLPSLAFDPPTPVRAISRVQVGEINPELPLQPFLLILYNRRALINIRGVPNLIKVSG